jgi:hypothetical protein
MTPRPKRNDLEILDLFYKRFAEVLQNEGCNFCQGYSIEEIERDMRRSGRPAEDGYEYAKNLEDFGGFDGFTASDIEVLDSASFTLSNIHDEIVSQWAIDNDIKPKLKDGEACTYMGTAGTVHHDERYLKLCKYLFRSEQWIKDKGNQGGHIINFEAFEHNR